MMMKSNVWSEKNTEHTYRRFPFVMKVIALLLAGVLGIYIPAIVARILSVGNGTAVERMLGSLSAVSILLFIVGVLLLTLTVVLRQDELTATLIIAIHLYVDWYLGLAVVAQIVTCMLLAVFFLARSPQYPWVVPRSLWLWGLFLALAVIPAIRGGVRIYDLAFYYPNIICGALLVFWLGIVIARDVRHVERFFKILTGLGALLAIHTIIQAVTGIVLFRTMRFDQFIATVGDFAVVSGSGVHRVGSFFVDPNWNGTFFATLLLLSIGLFVTSSTFLGKMLYFAESLLMLPALFFSYSNGAWISFFAGIVVFVVLVGRTHYRILLPLLVVIAAIAVILYFPSQLDLQLQHLSKPDEVSSRFGAWETGIRVIAAFPLTGVGLGLQAYLERAEPYRVPAQSMPLAHPHNSYLELAAMAGIPVLLVFIALLLGALWLAFRNWRLADVRSRALLGGGIAAVITLSINSWGINGWTLPPLAATGWLILGVISSPLLARTSEMTKKSYKSMLISKGDE